MKKGSFLDPVEIEMDLRKEMEKRRHTFIGASFVPDKHTIIIDEETYEEYGELLHTLGKMVCQALETWIVDKGYQCPRGIEIAFEKGDTGRKGFLIRASYKEAAPAPPADPIPSGGKVAEEGKNDGDKKAGCRVAGTLVDEGGGEVFAIRDPETLIGRGDRCKIRLSEGTVSEEHARMRVKYGRCTVEDLGSTNGTRVNLKRIGRTVLEDGDRVSFGEMTLTFRRVADRPEGADCPVGGGAQSETVGFASHGSPDLSGSALEGGTPFDT